MAVIIMYYLETVDIKYWHTLISKKMLYSSFKK